VSHQAPDPRQRIVAGAADMIRRRGLNATSVRDLAKHAQAPLGSTYHYFPGGKEQLATEAVQLAGDLVARILRRELAAGPAAGLRAFLALWRDVVTGSDFRAGCPVLAVSIEDGAEGDPTPVVAAAADVFATWRSLLAESLRAHGVERPEAGQLATLVVAAVEGAVVMCRATRSAGPLDDVAAQLDALVSAAVGGGPAAGRS
jgi:AcrR family transcriptional regulator